MIYHIIDHAGCGTMHNLIRPLSKHNNHIVYLQDDIIQSGFADNITKQDDVIIHSSGSKSGLILNDWRNIFNNTRKVFVFMHTSAKYQEFKNRNNFIKEYLVKPDVIVITPSKEVTLQYIQQGCHAETVQIGISKITKDYLLPIPRLAPFYGKIVTTCASPNRDYPHIKGIDSFNLIINEYKLHGDALICGYNQDDYIISRNFPYDDFVNILSHAKAYIQLSRYESYNTTAIIAKQVKTPTFLLSTEGVPSCMQGYEYLDIYSLGTALDAYIHSGLMPYDINEVCTDSINRESVQSFCNSLSSIIQKYDSKE